MAEKLDVFSKILLATSTINYMASACNSVNEQSKCIRSLNKDEVGDILEIGIEERGEALGKVLADLCAILEEFGNFLDGIDCVCAIDERVYNTPLDILLHGKDDVDKAYED